MAQKETISDQLKSVIVKAFRTQVDFTQEFGRDLPHLEKKLIALEEILSGQSVNIGNLANLIIDLGTILEIFQSLANKAQANIIEANVAVLKLKEVGDDPKAVSEMLVSALMGLAHSDIWMQNNSDFVAKVTEFAVPGTRREAIGKLSDSALIRWYEDLVREYDKRQGEVP